MPSRSEAIDMATDSLNEVRELLPFFVGDPRQSLNAHLYIRALEGIIAEAKKAAHIKFDDHDPESLDAYGLTLIEQAKEVA